MRGRVIGLVAFFIAFHAHADGSHRETAVELFAHGRALAAEGKCREAVPYFLDTLKIEASVGALLNLAECHEKLGAVGDAWSRYREAERVARDQHDDRVGLARSRADALEPQLPKIHVVANADVRVTIDGTPARDPDVVVAPGEHVVVASQSGKVAWRTIVATEGTAMRRVEVPVLATLPSPPNPREGAAQRTAGAITIIVSGVGLALGGVLAGVAAAKKSDATALATGPSASAFDDARSTAKTFADGSTAFFVAGAICAVAGIVVWLTAPHTRH